jgi:TctA family transporter
MSALMGGISMVAVLSGSAPLPGLAGGCFGVMLSMIGEEAKTGIRRWTFDGLFLSDAYRRRPSCSAYSHCRSLRYRHCLSEIA